MTIQTTYTQARASLARLMDAVTDDREIVIIRRRNGKDVAMIDAEEMESILETIHPLSSQKNAERLLDALRRSIQGEGQSLTVDQLRVEVGLEQDRP
jgi:antitoxin YefM